MGGGFGGLSVVKGLAGAPVAITLIDRRNHHLFQPLLYQVATASLATSEIASPIRALVRDQREVTTVLAQVTGVDAQAREVRLEDGTTVPYDTLVLATGAATPISATTSGGPSPWVSRPSRTPPPSAGAS